MKLGYADRFGRTLTSLYINSVQGHDKMYYIRWAGTDRRRRRRRRRRLGVNDTRENFDTIPKEGL